MKFGLGILILLVLCLACDNKSRQTEPIIYDDKPIVEQAESDTVVASDLEDSPKTEKKQATPAISSSSRSHNSSTYDNLRGFDPASEDNMDDNGMSRYMEANDDEGWD